MNAGGDQCAALVDLFIEEASDVDLVCYLARSGGEDLLRDLFEAMRDATSLSTNDLLHNINLVRQKKTEAENYPMHSVFQRLMHPMHRRDVVTVNGMSQKLLSAQH